MDQVQLDRVGGGNLLQLAVTGPDRLDVQADLFQQRLGRPDVAADVVVADQGDVVRALRFGELAGADDIVADRVVGDMMAERLGHAAKALAVAGDDRDIQILGGLLGHRVDIVADQTDRTFGQDRDPLGQREQIMCLLQQDLELLVAAVDDVLFLEIGGELHRKAGNTGDAAHQVAARTPGVPAAADRAVGDVHHVADRPPDNTFGAGIGAAAGAHDTGNGLLVGLDSRRSRKRHHWRQMRGAFLFGLFGIHRQGLIDHGLGGFLGDAFYFSYLV